MVIKGKARGGPVALATHLERRDTNERVSVLELRGVTARDVLGALREMDCMGSGAMSTRTLYHAAINTAPNERLTPEQKQKAADRLEKEMGFEGQPRIIVEHFKKDREHMHVVFLRIDIDRMVAIPDSHNYRKHEIVARDLEREFGHEHVQGVHVGREGKQRPERTPYHHEMQQAERTGLTPQQIKERVTELWKQADSGKAFAASVAADGWVLAKGDRRDFMLVDQAGGAHSLARRIEGVKASDIRQRLSDVDPASLPSVAEAKEMQRSQADAARTKEKEKEKTKAPHAPAPVLLKVARPTEKPSAVALQRAADAQRKSEKKSAPPPENKSQKPTPKPTGERLSSVGPIKRLYTAAVEKALGVFQKKKEPQTSISKQARVNKRAEPASKPAVAKARPAPQLTPTQEAMRQRRSEARAVDKKMMTRAIEHPTKSPMPTLNRDQTRERKHKLSREEIQMMLERQRQQRRERSGPSR